MKVLVTHHFLRRFCERILNQSIEYTKFVYMFHTDKEFNKKLIEKFENFFFKLMKDATIYVQQDNGIVISNSFSLILKKPVEKEKLDFVLKTIKSGSHEIFLRKGRMPPQIRKGKFTKGKLIFLYPESKETS